MKKIITDIRTLAALLIASATFVACSSEDNIIDEQPASQQVYTLSVSATKGGDEALTRALSLVGKTLNATWATTENIYVKKGDTWATGSLQPQADGTTATLKGSLSGITIAAGDNLNLQFPRSGELNYSGQVGTLEDIAAKYDYATATVTVASVSATGNINPTEATTTFQNQQAIVKFTLVDKADGTTPLAATQLTVGDGTNTYTVTPASATSEIYVAIPGIASQTVTLTATVGSDTYTYERANVTFTNGKYYEIAVKMTAAYKLLSAATAEDKGKIVGQDGNIYDTKAAATAAGTQAVAMIAYVGNGEGLALALTDEGGMTWSTAKSTCEGKTAVSGAAWLLPSQEQWKAMFKAFGGDEAKYDGLNAALATAGDELTKTASYWSSTPYDGNRAWLVRLVDAIWRYDYMDYYYHVRACLAFTATRVLAEATAEDKGKLVGQDGKIYDTKDAAEAAGTTAVAMIAYVGSETGDATYNHGLAIALADESGSMIRSTAKSTCEGKNTSLAVTGGTWMLPSKDQWKQMFKANGGNEGSYTGLNTAITTAGGTNLQGSTYYWSSSEYSPGVNPDYVLLDNGNATWYRGGGDERRRVRAGLAY